MRNDPDSKTGIRVVCCVMKRILSSALAIASAFVLATPHRYALPIDSLIPGLPGAISRIPPAGIDGSSGVGGGNGYVMTSNATQAQWVSGLPGSIINSGTIGSSYLPAPGGDISGTYASMTVAKINGSPLGTLTGATTGQALVFNGTNWSPGSGGGGGTPGGSNTQVQFNDSGSFGGNSAFTFTKATGALALAPTTTTTSGAFTGSSITQEANPGSSSSALYTGQAIVSDAQGSSNITGALFLGGLLGESVLTTNSGSGVVTNVYGLTSQIKNTGVGSITNAYAIDVLGPYYPSATGSIGTAVGLYISDQSASYVGTSYGIRQVGTSDLNVFAGPTTFSNALTLSSTLNGNTYPSSALASGGLLESTSTGVIGALAGGTTGRLLYDNGSAWTATSAIATNEILFQNISQVPSGSSNLTYQYGIALTMGSTSVEGLSIKGIGAQSANYLNIKDSTNASQLSVDSAGVLHSDGNAYPSAAVATGDILTGTSSGVIGKTAIGTTGQVLNVVGGVPTWSTISGLNRTTLVANLDLYVATTGSDSNPGTSGSPFLTIQHAYLVCYQNYDFNGYSATIHVADGTYTAGLNATVPLVGAKVINLVGNTTTPANCIISVTNAHAVLCQTSGLTVAVKGFKLSTTSAGNCIWGYLGGEVDIIGNMEFGASAGDHVTASEGGRSIFTTACTAYKITGNAVNHWHVYGGGEIIAQNITVTLTGTPAFSGNFAGSAQGGIYCLGDTFSGSATGNRYLDWKLGLIDTNGAGTTYLPGNAANGSAGTYGGQYY